LDIRLIFLLSIGVGLLLGVLSPVFISENSPDTAYVIYIFVIFFVVGFSGLVGLKRKEIPSKGFTYIIRGRKAVIGNVLWVAFFYGFILFHIIKMIW